MLFPLSRDVPGAEFQPGRVTTRPWNLLRNQDVHRASEGPSAARQPSCVAAMPGGGAAGSPRGVGKRRDHGIDGGRADGARAGGGPGRDGEGGDREPAAARPSSAGQGRALTLDEELILASDRSHSPLTVGVVAETDVAIHAARLRSSLYRSLRNHPIARARLAGGPGTASAWEFPAESGLPVDLIYEIHIGVTDRPGVDPASWRAVESLCSRPFDLRREPPVRLLLAHRPQGDVVGIVAHHTALDGMSALALFQEILAGCAVDGPEPAGGRLARRPSPASRTQQRAWTHHHLRNQPGPAPRREGNSPQHTEDSPRGTPSVDVPAAAAEPGPRAGFAGFDGFAGSTGSTGSAGFVGSADFGDGPGRRRLARHLVPCGPSLAQGYGVYPVDLPVPRPLLLADGRRMTVNDQLLAAAHLAAERWNSECGHRSGTVRVRMPIAARDAGPAEPRELGNRSGQVMITSTVAERLEPVRLAAAVVDQTAAAKEGPGGWAGTRMSAAVRAVTAATPSSLRTTVLRGGVALARPFLTPHLAVSNVGPVNLQAAAAAGGPRIRSMSFIGTSGMPQGLLICVAGNGDRLRLTFCHHRRLFDPAGVARFAEIYQESLAALATAVSEQT
ncbi:condensation domain protein [Parafrankia sp. EUN1f]|uniref:condensation domain protein n=1 Tax=Parafrankia sp. EUN1f TaxID=102897 RepID=UPI0001C4780A|nr:condensation domain protein [Parafrankia sp. EUN1f]EFC79526.1 condensation domain protein [Parafrankia sp. EUN1f]